MKRLSWVLPVVMSFLAIFISLVALLETKYWSEELWNQNQNMSDKMTRSIETSKQSMDISTELVEKWEKLQGK